MRRVFYRDILKYYTDDNDVSEPDTLSLHHFRPSSRITNNVCVLACAN